VKTVELGKDDVLVRTSIVPGIRGIIVLGVNMGFFFRFAWFQDEFEWFKVNWSYGEAESSDSGAPAVIPGVIEVEKGVAFGTRLNWDILDGVIAFLVVLGGNWFVRNYFDYELFSVP
jgi:hypothetical protein